MAVVDVTISGTLFDKLNRTTQQVVLIGEASLTGVGVGGGPIIPEPPQRPPGYPAHPIYLPGAHPEHPIVIPPPPTDPPQPPTEGKPPPPGGGWGWHPEYGWGYFPGSGGKPQPPA